MSGIELKIVFNFDRVRKLKNCLRKWISCHRDSVLPASRKRSSSLTGGARDAGGNGGGGGGGGGKFKELTFSALRVRFCCALFNRVKS